MSDVTKVTVNLPNAVIEQLRALAAANNTTLTDAIKRSIEINKYLTDRENANLSRYFTGRTVWLLDVTVAAKPRLYRYAPATMRSLPFPAPRVISPEVAAKVSAGLPTKPPDKSGVAALPVREQILYHKQVRERSRMRLILGEPVLPMP